MLKKGIMTLNENKERVEKKRERERKGEARRERVLKEKSRGKGSAKFILENRNGQYSRGGFNRLLSENIRTHHWQPAESWDA